MRFGFGLPHTTNGEELCRFAERADALGIESIWAGDHLVLPTDNTVQYPYSADGSLTVPVDSPSMDVMTVLSYVASRTTRVRIGSTVIIVPYRNPVVQAKMFSSLDVLTGGRVICGVGVGWLQKEFETLGVPYAQRGAITDEYLAAFKCLWTEPEPEYHGRHVSFDGIQFYPKPVQKPHLPIWVGGHSRRAVRRTVAYGDAWHPTRQTPDYVAGMLPYLRQQAVEAGRDHDAITISLKRSLHFTDLGFGEVPTIRSGAAVIGDTQQVLDDVRRCADLGIHQLTYDFRTDDVGECVQTMEHFVDRVASAVWGAPGPHPAITARRRPVMTSTSTPKAKLFPTTVVGSMPRPSYVQELLEPSEEDFLSPEERRSGSDAAVRYMIAMMEATGIDIITDGEWRRHSYTDVFAQMVDGFVHDRELSANYHTVVEPISNYRPFIAEEARFIKANTERGVKVCLPSPFILGQRMWHPEASKKAYPTRRDFVRATVPFLRAELEAVRDAGVDVAQIDEPHLSGFCDSNALGEFDNPDTDLDFLVECLNGVVEGVTGITVAVHVCRFNRGRNGWVNEGGFEPILPALNRLEVQQLTLEYSIPVSGDMRVLRDLEGDKEVALGCVDCRSAKVDTPEEIAARVERAMEFIPKERLLLAPDCGFAPGMWGTIPLDEAFIKLKNEARAAQILRERHG